MNLENKVKYNEISPSLQQIIDNKLESKEFKKHNEDEIRHIIQDERNYWNDVERICKEYTDDRVDELDVRLTKKIDNAEKRLEKKIDDLANSLSDIAFSGSYEDLGNQPIIYGMIIPFKGNKIPTGWHICDGTNGTPDLRDRFIVGAGRNYGVGHTGGQDRVTLSEYEMPVHRHTTCWGEAWTESRFGIDFSKGIGWGSNGGSDYDNYATFTTYNGGGVLMRTALHTMH